MRMLNILETKNKKKMSDQSTLNDKNKAVQSTLNNKNKLVQSNVYEMMTGRKF